MSLFRKRASILLAICTSAFLVGTFYPQGVATTFLAFVLAGVALLTLAYGAPIFLSSQVQGFVRDLFGVAAPVFWGLSTFASEISKQPLIVVGTVCALVYLGLALVPVLNKKRRADA